MAMKAYESYKNVDLPWLKRVPEHWEIATVNTLFFNNEEKNEKCTVTAAYQFKFGKIVKKPNFELTNDLIETYKNYALVRPNDIMINGLNLNYDFVTQRVGIVQEPGIITSSYISIRPYIHTNAKLYTYLFKAWDAQKVFNGMGTGIRRTLSWKELKQVTIPVPPKEEQDQIVRYLDWQNSRLNKLINAKKKEIALLEEQKQALISQAVTKGLDPHAPLKDSGIDWIGQIPEHWEMSYSKKLFNERKDKAFPADIQLTSSQKYGIVSQKEFMEKEGRRVTVVLTGSDILKHVGRGDFVISMRSFQGGLEYSTVEGKISSAYVMLIPRSNLVYDNYFKWLFKSACYIRALQSTSDLVRDGQALRYVNFLKIYLPIVPLNEQKQIADFIDIKTQKLTNVIEKISNKISLLQEYRTRLVADVVTGQIDVRHIAIPNYETVTETIDQPETAEESTISAEDQ